MTNDDLVQQAALRIFEIRAGKLEVYSIANLRMAARAAWQEAHLFVECRMDDPNPSTSVAEQLDKLVDRQEGLNSWSVTRAHNGRYYCSVYARGSRVANADAPTLAEAAEQATVKAMAMIHEGRSDD